MIRIITDSTSDLPKELAAQLGVEVMPLTVHFGAEGFRDGVEITTAQFYEKLTAATELPTTSQINPEEFEAKFQAYVDAGDQVIGIFLSSDLSGTCQSAHIARSSVGEAHVFVIDSRTVTFGLGLLVHEACRLRDSGLSAAEIATQIESLTGKVQLLAVLDTLKYLKMGGRISGVTAAVGGLLGITPIVCVKDGLVTQAGKSRGRKSGLQFIEGKLTELGVDTTRGVCFGHSNAPEAMTECKAYFQELAAKTAYTHDSDIGSVVGTHAGPGATGIAFFTL